MAFPSLTRYLLGCATVVLTAGFFAASAHAGVMVQAPTYLGLDRGLVGFWSFEGNHVSGVHVYDASGNGNRGVMTNGPKLVAGKLGQGMEFDGVDDYVDAGSDTSIDNIFANGGTISAWIRPRDWGEGTFGRIVHKLNGVSTDNGYSWSTDNNTGSGANVRTLFFEREFTDGGGSNDGLWEGPTDALVLNVWQHVVITYDESSPANDPRMFVNGAEIAVTERGDPGGTADSDDAQNLIIGNEPGQTRSFNGLMDDVRIYNRALSPDEIKRLYRIGATAKVGTTISTGSLQKGLVGHWTFDGPDMAGVAPATQYALDASGNGNRGTLTNGPKPVYGKIGQGLEFDGVDDYVSVDDKDVLDITGSITLTGWVKPDSSPAFSGILAKGHDNGASDRPINYMIDTGSDGKTFLFRYTSSNAWQIYAVNNFFTVGNWTHFAITFTFGTGASATVYRDGIVQSGTWTDGTGGTAAAGNTAPFKIGEDAGGNGEFPGVIDDVRVYNRALTADEIKRLYKNGATVKVGTTISTGSLQKGLVGQWTFDGPDMAGVAPATQYALDASGNGNRGTLTNGPKLVYGKIGQALAFDGVDDYVNVGDPASGALDFDNTESFTISAWVKGAAAQSVNNGGFIDKWPGGNGPGYWCLIRLSIRFRCQLGDGTNVAFSDSTTVPNNTWHHMVWRVDRTNQVADLYIDGVNENTDNISTIGNTDSGSTGFVIGDNSSNVINGVVDDVRIYNRVLSLGEIKRLYNMGW